IHTYTFTDENNGIKNGKKYIITVRCIYVFESSFVLPSPFGSSFNDDNSFQSEPLIINLTSQCSPPQSIDLNVSNSSDYPIMQTKIYPTTDRESERMVDAYDIELIKIENDIPLVISNVVRDSSTPFSPEYTFDMLIIDAQSLSATPLNTPAYAVQARAIQLHNETSYLHKPSDYVRSNNIFRRIAHVTTMNVIFPTIIATNVRDYNTISVQWTIPSSSINDLFGLAIHVLSKDLMSGTTVLNTELYSKNQISAATTTTIQVSDLYTKLQKQISATSNIFVIGIRSKVSVDQSTAGLLDSIIVFDNTIQSILNFLTPPVVINQLFDITNNQLVITLIAENLSAVQYECQLINNNSIDLTAFVFDITSTLYQISSNLSLSIDVNKLYTATTNEVSCNNFAIVTCTKTTNHSLSSLTGVYNLSNITLQQLQSIEPSSITCNL
ncbi:unnamed protein product, partial [Didymodactylos carnosus]